MAGPRVLIKQWLPIDQIAWPEPVIGRIRHVAYSPNSTSATRDATRTDRASPLPNIEGFSFDKHFV